MLQDTKNELLQNILLLGVKASYSINGEINNKNAIKRGSFKYDILDAIITLGVSSLLYQSLCFYVPYIYIYVYIRYILYI